jgi:hypothetical protein
MRRLIVESQRSSALLRRTCLARMPAGNRCPFAAGANDLCVSHLALVREGRAVYWYDSGQRVVLRRRR